MIVTTDAMGDAAVSTTVFCRHWLAARVKNRVIYDDLQIPIAVTAVRGLWCIVSFDTVGRQAGRKAIGTR